MDEGQIYANLRPKNERDKHPKGARPRAPRADEGSAGVTASVFVNHLRRRLQADPLQLRGKDGDALARTADELAAPSGGCRARWRWPVDQGAEAGTRGDMNRGLCRLARAERRAGGAVAVPRLRRHRRRRLGDPAARRATSRCASRRSRASAWPDLSQLPLTVATPTGSRRCRSPVATIRRTLPRVITPGPRPVISVAKHVGAAARRGDEGHQRPRGDDAIPPGVRMTTGGESKDQAEVFGNILSRSPSRSCSCTSSLVMHSAASSTRWRSSSRSPAVADRGHARAGDHGEDAEPHEA